MKLTHSLFLGVFGLAVAIPVALPKAEAEAQDDYGDYGEDTSYNCYGYDNYHICVAARKASAKREAEAEPQSNFEDYFSYEKKAPVKRHSNFEDYFSYFEDYEDAKKAAAAKA